MTLNTEYLPQVAVEDNKFLDSDEDRLCWRCGQPDSEHSYFQGVTYCLPDRDEDTGEPVYNREIQLDPPSITDEELVQREAFMLDVRSWTL